MKRVIKASWNGTANIRREIEDMIEKGCTISDIEDLLDEYRQTSDLDSTDYNMLMQFAKTSIDQENSWKSWVKSSTDLDTHTSQCSFDFVWDDDYDLNEVKANIERVVDDLGVNVTGIDFYSVDYSTYPEYADANVSQCSFDFEWAEDYDSKAIRDAIESVMLELGYEVVGVDFNSL